MKNSLFLLSSIFFCSIFMSGCDSVQPIDSGQVPPPVEVPQQQNAVAPDEDNAPNEDNTVTVKAEPGLSGKGNYGTPTGNNPMEIITVPISTMFRTQDRLVLQQVEHAMNLYKAEHGMAPATHAEFWEKIIVANNLQPNQSSANRNKLPQLPAGQTYVYDPKDGVLKVRKPKD